MTQGAYHQQAYPVARHALHVFAPRLRGQRNARAETNRIAANEVKQLTCTIAHQMDKRLRVVTVAGFHSCKRRNHLAIIAPRATPSHEPAFNERDLAARLSQVIDRT